MVGRQGCDERGQATVELAVVLPIAIIVAVIVVNALAFLGSCATFDRVARQAVCAWGAAPAAGQDSREVASAVKDELERAVGAQNVVVSVAWKTRNSALSDLRLGWSIRRRCSVWGCAARYSASRYRR